MLPTSLILPTFIAAAVVVADTSAPVLTPSSKWQVDYQTDMCLASRDFGADPRQPVTFAIDPSIDLLSPAATLFVIVPNDRGSGNMFGKADVTLSPANKTVKVDYASGVLKDGSRAYKFFADGDLMGNLADSSVFTITVGKRSVAIAIGKPRPVLSALATCNTSLLKSWGVDPAAPRAAPLNGVEPGRWFPPDSYPADARRRNVQGRVVIAISVSSGGKPTACKAIGIKADPVLTDATCHLAMSNARFEPADDEKSRSAIYAVRWELRAF